MRRTEQSSTKWPLRVACWACPTLTHVISQSLLKVTHLVLKVMD